MDLFFDTVFIFPIFSKIIGTVKPNKCRVYSLGRHCQACPTYRLNLIIINISVKRSFNICHSIISDFNIWWLVFVTWHRSVNNNVLMFLESIFTIDQTLRKPKIITRTFHTNIKLTSRFSWTCMWSSFSTYLFRVSKRDLLKNYFFNTVPTVGTLLHFFRECPLWDILKDFLRIAVYVIMGHSKGICFLFSTLLLHYKISPFSTLLLDFL